MLLAQDHYTLDATGQRLGREHTDAQGQISVTTWDYDDAGRLIKETAPSRITAYELDAVGNVIRKTVNGTATVSVYDANDRLLSQTTNGVTTTYSHDAQGNTLTQSTAGQQKSFLYDGKNQLIAATVNGQSLSFGYDIEGIRSSKTVNGQTTRYLTDHNTPYARVVYESNGVTGTQYRYGLGQQLLSQNQAGQERFFLQDALGSTQALVDATGTLTDSYAYDAYGDIIAQSGSTSSAYRYAGEQYDQDLGLYYNRARYYDQGVGRFSQMDSYLGRDTAPITLNKYAYANANPVMYTDPSGQMGLGDVGTALRGMDVLLDVSATAARVAVNQSRLLVSSVIRPLLSSEVSNTNAASAVSTVVAGIVARTCQANESCQLPMPIIPYSNPNLV